MADGDERAPRAATVAERFGSWKAALGRLVCH